MQVLGIVAVYVRCARLIAAVLSYHFQGPPYHSWQQVTVFQTSVLVWKLNKVSKRVVSQHLQA